MQHKWYKKTKQNQRPKNKEQPNLHEWEFRARISSSRIFFFRFRLNSTFQLGLKRLIPLAIARQRVHESFLSLLFPYLVELQSIFITGLIKENFLKVLLLCCKQRSSVAISAFSIFRVTFLLFSSNFFIFIRKEGFWFGSLLWRRMFGWLFWVCPCYLFSTE